MNNRGIYREKLSDSERENSLRRRVALAAGHAMASVQRAVKYGRIRQSLTYWCLNTDWNWDIDRICTTAKDLGLPKRGTRSAGDVADPTQAWFAECAGAEWHA